MVGFLCMVRCAIWYHLCNLINVKNNHGGVLILKLTLLHGCFSCFLNCTNGTKSCNASHVTCIDIIFTSMIKVFIFRCANPETYYYYFADWQSRKNSPDCPYNKKLSCLRLMVNINNHSINKTDCDNLSIRYTVINLQASWINFKGLCWKKS